MRTNAKSLNEACRREYGCTFDEYYEWMTSGAKKSLRRMQWEAAKKELESEKNTSSSMLQFLGKQYLGQNEKVITEQNHRFEREREIAEKAVRNNPHLVELFYPEEDIEDEE